MRVLESLTQWLRRKIAPHGGGTWTNWGHWSSLVHNVMIGQLGSLSGKLLEIGCGEGLFAAKVLERFPGIAYWGGAGSGGTT